MRANAAQTETGPLGEGQMRQLQALARELAPAELEWASGYLAGLAAGGEPRPAAQAAPAPASLTILYGSQTGNGRGIAKRLEARLRERGIRAVLRSMAEYRPSQLARERNVLFIVSTHGEGDPPDDALELHEFLFGKRAPQLPQLGYAVLALGDSSYAQFCQTGRDFDQRLEALGARRWQPRVECDVDFEDPAGAWIGAVLAQAEERLGASQEARAPSAVTLRAVPDAPRHSREQPYLAELLVNQKITGRDSTKDVRHVELAIEGSGLHYHPGDSLGIVPRNPPDTVERLISALDLAGEAPVTTRDGERPLAEALASAFEITQLSRSFLERYATLAGSDVLRSLLAEDRRAELAEYLSARQVIDVVREHPARVDAQAFVGSLRGLQPRLYSIASSLAASPGEVHLTVGVVRYQAFDFLHYGAASSHLAERVADGATVPVYVEPNERFRLPADGDLPVIMVGPGTGVAPFRAFVEERAVAGAQGRNWLIFGDRHFEADFLYQLEWLRHRRDGRLARLDVAFSRDQQDKVYVQHRLREHAAELYAWLEDGAHFYVCGDAKRMAGDVHSALIDAVAAGGGLSAERAQEYVRALQRSGRYQRDVY